MLGLDIPYEFLGGDYIDRLNRNGRNGGLEQHQGHPNYEHHRLSQGIKIGSGPITLNPMGPLSSRRSSNFENQLALKNNKPGVPKGQPGHKDEHDEAILGLVSAKNCNHILSQLTHI